MAPVIVDQPWSADATEDLRRPDGQVVVCPTTGQPLRAYPNQIIVWATLTPDPFTSPSPSAVLFPVLLDTGFNDAFLMQRRQVDAWLTPAFLTGVGKTGQELSVGRERVPGWDIALWLYPNVPGTRDPDSAAAPVWLRLPLGVPLTPPGSAYTKEKPLLGLRAFRVNELSLRLDGRPRRVWLDAPQRWPCYRRSRLVSVTTDFASVCQPVTLPITIKSQVGNGISRWTPLNR